MSFLTPLYIAGLAAIALPLVFHLIRRTPRGQTPFSSLMFLTPSPPRITRRSRLDHLLLLFLRALALILLALAFARPFFREAAQFSLHSTQGERVAILVDASASMRRGDLWRQAQQETAAILASLKPTDRAALFTFDRQVRTLLDFDDQTEIDPRRRAALANQRLRETAPTWAATDLGEALAIVADRLDALDRGSAAESDVRRRIVLVSDFQQGARLDALQGYEWPGGVELEIKPLAPETPTNAGVHLAGGVVEPDDATSSDDRAAGGRAGAAEVRVRVANSDDAAVEQFQLVWLDAQNQPVGKAAPVYVPPGQSRIVRLRRPEASDDLRLALRGDAHPFDNTLYLAPPRQEEISIVYLGEDAADDPQGTRYYLERAFPSTPHIRVQVTTPQAHEPLVSPAAAPPRLVAATQALSETRLAELRRYLERGGQTLLVATDVAAAQGMAPLLAPLVLTAEEAAPADYALWGAIDFTHPLLAPFADPRYSDFTKIHFWKHRKLTFAAAEGDEASRDKAPAALRVLARFDSGDPALVEWPVGAGRLYVLASSWRPGDSQLARSSKFVPLLWGLVGAGDQAQTATTRVADPVRLSPPPGASPRIVRKPDGTEAALPADTDEFDGTDAPGVYAYGEQRFAVNLDPAESQTAPGSPEALEQYGVTLTSDEHRTVQAERERQLRDVELENRQKVWRWLIAAALGVLVLETWLAGRQSRATVAPAPRENS